jgi:hypothetical protein
MNIIIFLIFSVIGAIVIGIGMYIKMNEPVFIKPEIITIQGYIEKVSYKPTNDQSLYEFAISYSYKPYGNDSKVLGEIIYPTKISIDAYQGRRTLIFGNENQQIPPNRNIGIKYLKNNVRKHEVEDEDGNFAPFAETENPIPPNPYPNILFISGGFVIFTGLLLSILGGGKKNKPPMRYQYMRPNSFYD